MATLFIDVAGFTRLSEMLVSLGPEGAEILESTIARYFDVLLDVMEPFQGLPIKISGDALTVIFAAEGGDLREPAMRAIACADALRRAGRKVAQVMVRGCRFSLAHKIGVGGGRLLTGIVGDPRLRSEFIFAGEALDSAVGAEHHAQAGEVWVAPGITRLLGRAEWWSRADVQGFCRLKDEPGLVFSDARAQAQPLLEPLEETISILTRYAALIPPAAREHAAKGALNYLCRHQNLTVLFAGCPGMVIDRPESLHQLDAHYRRMQLLIEQYGGFLSEFEAGDKGAKLIVFFGAPTVLEDPCGQAARCAQAMQQAAREMGLVHDQRMGLTTGRLYVGRIGCRSLVKYSALGDRMNLAARLMTAASRWQVLADHYTVEHSRQAVRWAPPTTLKVKGKDEPVSVSPLVLSRVYKGAERRGMGLIGRQGEREECQRLLENLFRGVGELVRVEGPAGVGKTRQLEAIHRQALEMGVPHRTIRWDGALTSPHSSPLQAFRPLLLDLMEADERTGGPALLDRFEAWHSALPAPLRPAATLLASVVDVPWMLDPIVADLPPERRHLLRQRSLVECVLHCATTVPRLFLMDNGERLDMASIDALTELTPVLPELPLLIFVGHRPAPNGQKDPLAPLRQAPRGGVMPLEPLGPRDAARLAARHLKTQRLDPELAGILQSRASGNPLLIEAWLDFLQDHGRIRVLDDVACWSGSRELHAMPDRLEALLLSQLDRLPPAAQLTVRVASIIGLSVQPEEVAALHPEGVSAQLVTTHLHLAAQADLLWYDRASAPRMFFSRPELREAIHESLPFQLRRTLHARRVDQIRAAHPGPSNSDQILELAHHHEYISDWEGRRQAFSQAVEVCRGRYNHSGMVYWGRRMLEACEKLQDTTGMLEAFSQLHYALSNLGEFEERQAVLQRWIVEAERVAAHRSLATALRAAARLRLQRGDLEAARRTLEQALSVAHQLNEPESLVDSLLCAVYVHGESNRKQEALAAVEEAKRLVEAVDADRAAKIYLSHGYALIEQGESDRAYLEYRQALQLSTASGDLWSQAVLTQNIGIALWRMGHPEEAHQTLMRAIELNRQIGDRLQLATALINLGYSFLNLGDLIRARQHTEEGLRLCARLGYVSGELTALGNLGEIHWLLGALDEAEACYTRCDALIGNAPLDSARLELTLRQGELALSQSQWCCAMCHFNHALERARASLQEGSELKALEGLAEAHVGYQAWHEAIEVMDEAIQKLEKAPELLSAPQRLWWRAARITERLGQRERALEYRRRAGEQLDAQLKPISSTAVRRRLIRAFPWNREIARRTGAGMRMRGMEGMESLEEGEMEEGKPP